MSEGRASSSPVKATAVFGSLAFNDKAQQERLPKPVYRALRATITRGEPLEQRQAIARVLVPRIVQPRLLELGAPHGRGDTTPPSCQRQAKAAGARVMPRAPPQGARRAP